MQLICQCGQSQVSHRRDGQMDGFSALYTQIDRYYIEGNFCSKKTLVNLAIRYKFTSFTCQLQVLPTSCSYHLKIAIEAGLRFTKKFMLLNAIQLAICHQIFPILYTVHGLCWLCIMLQCSCMVVCTGKLGICSPLFGQVNCMETSKVVYFVFLCMRFI